jgi:hypothetical protein
MVGLNNALPADDSAGDAVRGVAAILAAIRVEHPGAKVLLLGVLPSSTRATRSTPGRPRSTLGPRI